MQNKHDSPHCRAATWWFQIPIRCQFRNVASFGEHQTKANGIQHRIRRLHRSNACVLFFFGPRNMQTDSRPSEDRQQITNIRSKLQTHPIKSTDLIYILDSEGRSRSTRKSSHILSSFGLKTRGLARNRSSSCRERKPVSMIFSRPGYLAFFLLWRKRILRSGEQCCRIWHDPSTKNNSHLVQRTLRNDYATEQ